MPWPRGSRRPSRPTLLDLVLQLGPCRVEPVGRRLLRVRGGSDQPAVVAAIRRAGGERDGTGEFWWIEARNLRTFADELRPASLPQCGQVTCRGAEEGSVRRYNLHGQSATTACKRKAMHKRTRPTRCQRCMARGFSAKDAGTFCQLPVSEPLANGDWGIL